MLKTQTNTLCLQNPDSSIEVSVTDSSLFKKLSDHFSITYNIENSSIIPNWTITVETKENFDIPEYLRGTSEEHFIEHGEKANISIRDEGIYIWKENEFWLVRKENGIFIEGSQNDILYQIVRKAVRQIFTYELERNEGYRIHASSCNKDDISVAFLGNKGAGKTTILLSMIAFENYNYITNDLLEVRNKEGKMEIKGWPTVCLIGRGTLSGIDKYKFLIPNEENALDPNKPKVEVQINDLETTLDTTIVNTSHLNVVCFPELNLESKETILKQMSTEDGIKETLDHIINEDKDHPDWLLLRSGIEYEVNLENLNKVKFYKLLIGKNLNEAALYIDATLAK